MSTAATFNEMLTVVASDTRPAGKRANSLQAEICQYLALFCATPTVSFQSRDQPDPAGIATSVWRTDFLGVT